MKNYKKLYEELRQAIDGGYSLATHENALESVRSTQRIWVGLKDEEMMDAIYVDDTPMERGRRVEAKLKEKNT